MKFFLPVGITLVTLFAVFTLLLGRSQSARIQHAFEENLLAIGTNARYTLHWEAEAYCKRNGMAYHRVPLDRVAQGPVGDLERAAISAFREQPTLDSYKGTYPGPDGADWMYVLTPGRLQEGCLVYQHASIGT